MLGAEFQTLDDNLGEASIIDIPEKLILISKKMTSEQFDIEEDFKSLSQLALFDKKVTLLGKHIGYANEIRNKLRNGYQHLISIENQLLNQEKRKVTDRKASKEIKSKDKNLFTNLIELKQEEFIVYLGKILGDEINQLDWKRILCLYCSALNETLNKNSIKTMKSILTKDVQKELDNFIVLIKKLEERNLFKEKLKNLNIKNLVSQIQSNALDQSKYPTVNSSSNSPSNPAKLLIFMSGGISFNELNLVKTNTNLILISDALLYPKLFFEALL